MTALALLKVHWLKVIAVLLIAGAYGAGRVHQGWLEDSRSLDKLVASLEAERAAFTRDMDKQKEAADAVAVAARNLPRVLEQLRTEFDAIPDRAPCPVTPDSRERLRDAFRRIDEAVAAPGS